MHRPIDRTSSSCSHVTTSRPQENKSIALTSGPRRIHAPSAFQFPTQLIPIPIYTLPSIPRLPTCSPPSSFPLSHIHHSQPSFTNPSKSSTNQSAQPSCQAHALRAAVWQHEVRADHRKGNEMR
ncbi:hypothetical protein BKA81DRAFT_345965 [Phyllosticta paracitricarpa]